MTLQINRLSRFLPLNKKITIYTFSHFSHPLHSTDFWKDSKIQQHHSASGQIPIKSKICHNNPKSQILPKTFWAQKV
jgi:hypothetical protein